MSANAHATHDAHHHGSYLERKGGFWVTVWDWATTIDHKKIGIMYLVAILSMFFFGGVAALLVRLDLLTPVRTHEAWFAKGSVAKPTSGALPAQAADTQGKAQDVSLPAGTMIEWSLPAAQTPPKVVPAGSVVAVLDAAGHKTGTVTLKNDLELGAQESFIKSGVVERTKSPVGADVTRAQGETETVTLPAGTAIEWAAPVAPPSPTAVPAGSRVALLDSSSKATGETAVLKDSVAVGDPEDGAEQSPVVTGQLFGDGKDINVGNKWFNTLFTLHGAIMVFMVIVPSVPASLGNFLLPLMLGAKDVAFPRLNLLSWYIYVLGSLFAVTGIIFGQVDTGWTFYTPYSATTDPDHAKVAIMVMAAFILGFSSILTGLNFIVTVHKLRAPGMGWFDMPLFVWAVYSAAIIQVLATPVIGITLALLTMERVFHIGIFDPALGGDPVLFQHFFWFYSHPVVYVMILPGMGIISDVLAVQAHKKIFGYRAICFASLGIAGVSFIVWGHHMFTSMSEVADMVFSAMTFLVAIPTAVKVFNWIATLYKSSIAINTPMLYVLVFLFEFSIGGLTGLPLGTLSTDLHLHHTYFVVAHFHYVMMGGTIMALMAGLHHWWPKFFGKMYNEPGAMFATALVFIGFNLTFFTQFFLGARGMPRRYASYIPEFHTLHTVSTVGSWFLLLGFMVHLLVFLHSLAAGKKASANPWGGLTLEWEAASPPIEHNFEHEPIVTHGPYDFETTVPPHWDPKDYPIPAENLAAAGSHH